jgi:hypothetical protein
MYLTLKPWQLYLVIIAGWVHRQQQFVIEYLIIENRILQETHGKKRILLTDDQRCRLSVKGKILGRKLLAEVGTVFTPDTILRWHRQLVAQKWDYTAQRKQQPGRPRVRQEIVDLVVRMAKENSMGLRSHPRRPGKRGLSYLRYNCGQHPQSPWY